MRNKFIIFAVLLFLAIFNQGCGKLKEIRNDVPPGRVVAISLFKSNCDPLVKESIQDVFVDIFFKKTNAKPVEGEDGDIVIKGLITATSGRSERTKGSLVGLGNASVVGGVSGSFASGTYISGITIQVYKSDELIATHSVSQNLGQGVLFSPVNLASKAANYISTILVRQNEIGRK